jgi:hypothetical protein
MNLNKLLLFFAALQFMAFPALSQDEELASLSGSITDASSGEALIGANIVLIGTYKGAAADFKH